MSYYRALVSKWPELGAIDPAAVEAAKAAVAKSRPTRTPQADEDSATRNKLDAAFQEADAAWRDGFASLFAAPSVIAKLERINALTVPGAAAPVPIVDVMHYLRRHNLWLPIKAAAAAGSSVGAIAAVDYNDDLRAETIDFALPIVQSMLAELKSKSLLTQEHADALLAMSTPLVPWWQSAGYSSAIGTGDLEAVLVQLGEALV